MSLFDLFAEAEQTAVALEAPDAAAPPRGGQLDLDMGLAGEPEPALSRSPSPSLRGAPSAPVEPVEPAQLPSLQAPVEPVAAEPAPQDLSTQVAAGPLERARKNVAAIRAAKAVAAEGRAAEPGELEALRAYSGWGGAADAFRDNYEGAGMPGMAAVNAELRGLLTEEEYIDARSSTLTAFYTPEHVARPMIEALSLMGLGGHRKGARSCERVLEPGCGTGNLMATADSMGLGLAFDAVEADSMSALIAGALHPKENVVKAALEDCYVSEGSYDAVVGNVPYSDAVSLRAPDGHKAPIHDYFIERAVEALRPGGVAVLLTSRHTLDKRSQTMRGWVARRAELVGAVRLPSETFRAQAGTDAACDVLVLRKRAEVLEEPAGAWVEAASLEAPDGTSVPVSPWFLEHPDCVVGGMSVALGRYGYDIDVSDPRPLGEQGAQLAAVVRGIAASAGDIRPSLGPRAEEPVCAPVPETGLSEFEYSVDAFGNVWYGAGESLEAVALAEPARSRLAAMVRLRDRMRDTLALERTSSDEVEVEWSILALDAEYDGFVSRHGRLCEPANRRLWATRRDYSWSMLIAAEETDSLGRFTGKGSMLSTRAQSPVPPLPEHASPADALVVSLDRLGRVDMRLICRLTGLEEADAVEALGDSVVVDPETREVVTADEYLTGDVLAKIDALDALADEVALAPLRARRGEWLVECGAAAVADAVSALADGGLKERMNAIEGSWGAFCDPLGSKTALDTSAALRAADVSRVRYGTAPSAFQVIGLVDDLREGCALTGAGPEGEFSAEGLWGLYCAAANASNGSWPVYSEHRPMFSVSVWMTRRAAEAPAAVVSDEALACVLAHGGVVGSPAMREALASMLPGVEVPAPDAGDPGRFVALARALRADPDVLDCMLVASAGYERALAEAMAALHGRFHGLFSGPSLSARERTAAGVGFGDGAGLLARHKAARAGFEASRPVEVDEERLGLVGLARARLVEAAPEPLAPSEIAVSLGAPWVPAPYYYAFAKEAFGFGSAAAGSTALARTRWVLSRSDETGAWQFRHGGAPELDPSVRSRYGTPAMGPIELMESAMNGSSIVVTRPDPRPDPERPNARVKDPAATAQAYHVRESIQAAFAKWAFADPARAEALAAIYNRRFNNIVRRRYDGSGLTLPGSNPSIEMRAHQLDAVARVLHAPAGTLIAHSVGAGKTFAGVASVMEARRVGKASKPLVAVPNHLTEQWAADFLRLYPSARVLVMDKSDMGSQDATRAFWQRAATGDWDAVIVGQSRFDMLAMSPERRKRSLERRASELSVSIEHLKAGGNRFSVKQAEAMRKRVALQLKELQDKGKTEGVCFEELGFDFLLVDEAHNYKNLAVAGRSVAGMSSGSSKKCERLLDVCDYLRELGKGSNIVFATGTPVSNTMSELYNMERYLDPGLLRSQGVYFFSDWAQTFGETVQSVEVRPESNGFQVKERFARFHNLPELMAAFHTFADIMTSEDLDLDVPEVDFETVAVEADEEQRAMVELLGERAEAVRQGSVDPSVDNMLKITFEGRALALSPKLLADLPDRADLYGSEAGKLALVAANVHDVWLRTADDKGAQLVFCDASTPGKGRWNVYDEIRAQLEGLGVPREQIAFVHEAGDDPKKRDELFERVNAGEVRVLMGSTQKLGTGTNVQARLAAIHDVDCPWRPADLEQRLGRVRRQGNMFGRVQDFRYVTTGTFDSYLYQTVERKQRFISQVFTNRSPARSGDDLDETVLDYATIKAVASGDPLVRERLMKENRLTELELQRQGWASTVARARAEVERRFEPAVAALEERERSLVDDGGAFADVAARAAADRPLGRVDAVVRGERYADRAEAVRAVVAAGRALKEPGTWRIGEYYGLALSIVVRPEGGRPEGLPYVSVAGAHEHTAAKVLSLQLMGPETCLRQVDRVVESVATGLPAIREKLGAARARLEAGREAAGASWELQGEYDRIRRELAATDPAPLGAPVAAQAPAAEEPDRPRVRAASDMLADAVAHPGRHGNKAPGSRSGPTRR